MDDKHTKILVIEDNPGDARLIREMLVEVRGATSFDLECADRLSTGLERLAEGGSDVILLDLSLPDSHGLDTFIRVHAQASMVPIIVLTGLDDETLAIKAVQNGAQDYLVKGQVDGNLLARSIRYSIERKRAEEALKQANVELKKADELKTQFLSITSHELRTPITPMVAQLQMVLGGYFGEITQEQTRSLDMVLKNTTRLDRLIGDILDISKLESGAMKFSMTKANLNELVENAVETMRPKAQNKDIKLTLKEDKIPEMALDKDRIIQVVVNLINNAIKFTDIGGTIDVELSDDKTQATIKVRDDGIGIKKEDQKRIFRPFEQVDSSMTRAHEGTGLGLAICKGIVAHHSGEIWIESEPGKGSAFIFTVPHKHIDDIQKREVMFDLMA